MPCCSIANDLSVACTVHPEVVFLHDCVLARLVLGLLFRRGVSRNTRCTLAVRIDRNGLGRERYSVGSQDSLQELTTRSRVLSDSATSSIEAVWDTAGITLE